MTWQVESIQLGMHAMSQDLRNKKGKKSFIVHFSLQVLVSSHFHFWLIPRIPFLFSFPTILVCSPEVSYVHLTRARKNPVPDCHCVPLSSPL